MHAVIETHQYLRRAKDCGVTEDERVDIVLFLAANPMAGDEIQGTGGARKVRFARPGKGKSGGYRIITFYGGTDILIFLMTIYAKNEGNTLSQAGRNDLKKILNSISDYYRKRPHEKSRS